MGSDKQSWSDRPRTLRECSHRPAGVPNAPRIREVSMHWMVDEKGHLFAFVFQNKHEYSCNRNVILVHSFLAKIRDFKGSGWPLWA